VHPFRTFARARDGKLVVRLRGGELVLLGMIATEVRGLISEPDENPVTTRLFPRAYLDPTEEESEAAWQGVVGGELRDQKLAALDDVRAVAASASPDDKRVELRLDAEQEAHLLSALNDARLALGSLIQDTEGAETTSPEDVDPRAVLDWLTGLEADLVYLLLDETP
jgi:hypothetical protein